MVVITGTYTYYAARQANAAKKTAKAAFDAIEEAKRDNIASIKAQQEIAQTALAKSQENFVASSTAAAKQFSDTLKQMRAQTKEQGRAADTARESLTSLQRAFVFQDGVDTTIIDSGGSISARFSAKWGNAGATPTREMTTHCSYLWLSGKLPDDFSFPDLWDSGAPHIHIRTLLGPKGATRVSLNPPIPIDTMKQIQDHRLFLYFWGWARYRDIFKGTPEHITKFCSVFVPIEKQIPLDEAKPGVSHLVFELQNYERNNCADEECKSD